MRRAQAVLFRERWREVEAIDEAELRAMSGTERVRRLAACMLMGRDLGIPQRSDSDPETEEVRKRWCTLKTTRS